MQDNDSQNSRRFTAVLDLPFDKYDHVVRLDDTDGLDHRYVCLDCGRLLQVSWWRRWLHTLITCP